MCILVSAGILAMTLASCRQQMADQPKYLPLAPSSFFRDGRSARPVPGGAIARESLNTDEGFISGIQSGDPATVIPFAVTREFLDRGRERFNIYCSPCHGEMGNGQGMVVLRGMKHGPPSFHIDRLREEPVGHFFEVITNGFGGMPNYAAQISHRDRWAIVAYIRALQLSQMAKLEDVPGLDRRKLENGKPETRQ